MTTSRWWIALMGAALASTGCDVDQNGGATQDAVDDVSSVDVADTGTSTGDAETLDGAAHTDTLSPPDTHTAEDAAPDVTLDTWAAADTTPPHDVPQDSAAPDTASATDTVQPTDTQGPADTQGPSDTQGPLDTQGPTDTAVLDDTQLAQDSEEPSDTAEGADTADTLGPLDTTSVDTSTPPDTSGPDTTDPCAGAVEDTDGDGLPDLCDACPEIPRVLVFDVNSDRKHGRAAVALLGCEHTIAGVGDFVALLESGEYGAVVLDMPDARPEGDWASALLDFIVDGGVALLSTWRPNDVSGPSLAATFGAWAGDDAGAPRSFQPTWRDPVFTTPYDLTDAAFEPDPDANAWFHGPNLLVTAGRPFARFASAAAIVQSNGGRTFIDGFLWDDYGDDDDGDGIVDIVELVANQLVAAARARLPAPDHDAPEISNFSADDAVVRYDLPILRGSAEDDADFVTVWTNDDLRLWPVSDGRLKVLTPLQPGDNYISLRDRGRVTYLTLAYQPQTNPRRVRLVYALASDGDGHFDAPAGEPNSLANATARLGLGGRLIQSMMADRLAEAGFGHRTFRLKRDANGEPDVYVWSTSLDTGTWWGMTGAEMFSWVWQHRGELPPCDDCRTVVMLGMTHYDAAQNTAYAHTALGGGGLALFGSGTLYAWAESLDELVARLADDTPIATLSPPVFDDSGFRAVRWANYATGLGAVLHELGHALNLPHPTDYEALMNRGIDRVNRLLVSREPPSQTTGGLLAIWPSAEPRFTLTNAARLRYHRWLSLDDVTYTVDSPPTVTVDGDDVHLHSPAGVRVVAYGRPVPQANGSVDYRVAGGQVQGGASAAADFVLSLAQLRFVFPSESELRLRVTDDQGNMNDDIYVTLSP